MPDLVGRTLQNAQDSIQALTADAIFFTGSVDALGAGRSQILDSNWQVCSQNVSAGAEFSADSKIEFAAVKLTETCP